MSQKVVFVDVDDTLVRSFGSKRIPVSSVVELVRRLKKAGFVLYCWSSGGAEYARATAQELGIEDCFAEFLPKPTIIVDDEAPSNWRRLTHLHPNEAVTKSADEFERLIDRPMAAEES